MMPAKRTRLYFGLLLIACGLGASLLGFRAERFIEARHADKMESHGRRRADLERLAADDRDATGRRLLAEHDEGLARVLDSYRFGRQVSRSMWYGGFVLDLIGALLVVSYLRRRRKGTEQEDLPTGER
jgi:hypothetical protein